MANLIVLGNINQFTFANSIIAANATAETLFGCPLENIFVLHSVSSRKKLRNDLDWVTHIENNGVRRDLLVDRTLEITSKEESIKNFVQYIEFIVKGMPDEARLMVDLTNGTSLHKNFLSIACYVLDIRHQYAIDVTKLFELTNEKGFLPKGILSRSYVAVPDSTRFDSIAYLNLTEMIRYKRIVEAHTAMYTEVDPDLSDPKFFEGNLMRSIQLKMLGDKSRDNAVYRIAASSIAASVEDLIGILVRRERQVPDLLRPRWEKA